MGFDILKNLLIQFTSSIPNILGAIVVFLIGMVSAKVVRKLVAGILSTIGIDKLAEKFAEIDIVQQYDIKVKPSVVLSQIIYYMMLLVFMAMASDVLKMAAISQLISDLINYIPILLTALVVVIVGLFSANALKNVVASLCKSIGIPSYNLIANFIFYFVFLTALISALGQAKIDTDFVKNNLSILLGGGVAAFAIGYGFASKDMMSNFLASFYSRRHFNIGDTVKIGNVIGKIIFADNTCVKIQAAERLVIIPLSKLMKEEVEILPNDYLKLDEHE